MYIFSKNNKNNANMSKICHLSSVCSQQKENIWKTFFVLLLPGAHLLRLISNACLKQLCSYIICPQRKKLMAILCLVCFCQFLNSLSCSIKCATENNLPHGVDFCAWFLLEANLEQKERSRSLGCIEREDNLENNVVSLGHSTSL